MLKKTSWNPYSSSGSTRAIKRPLKGKKGCSALKQLRPLSPLLGAPKEVLRKCQFLIKTRGHDDHFFQRIHTIRRTQRGMAWMLSLFWPHELGVPSPQIKKGLLITEVSICPKSEFWMWVLVLWARPGRSQALITTQLPADTAGWPLQLTPWINHTKEWGMLYTGWDNPLFYPSRILFMLE